RALEEGKQEMQQGEWEAAIKTFQHGLSVAQGIPFQRGLASELGARLRLAEQKRATQELHQLANRIRFLGAAEPSPAGLRGLEASCRSFWENRVRIVERLMLADAVALEPSVRDDLFDLAIFWADLQARLAPPDEKEEVRRQVLFEAEALFGPSPELEEERGVEDAAWKHYVRGRTFLRSGNLQRAAEELEHAVRLQPQSLWANFYHGLCAYRLGRYADAATAYSVCIGAAPEPAGCFYNRALAYEALGRDEHARQDYDQALRLDPTLASGYLNRGMLHYRARRYAAARDDLQQTRELDADPAVVLFNLALVNLACGDRKTALDNLG